LKKKKEEIKPDPYKNLEALKKWREKAKQAISEE